RDVAGPDFDAVINRLSIAELGKRCVIFSGGSGRGKTFAMMCAHPEARKVEMFNAEHVELLKDAVTFCRLNPVVILDDVGSEPQVNEYGVKSEPFSDFILAWYTSASRPRLLITTNLNSVETHERYGERVMSRLLAMAVTLRLKGVDHRKNESCATCDESHAVQKVLREFQADVNEWGKDALYPEAAFKFYAQRLTCADEYRALRRGIDRIMAGHKGCQRPNDGPTIAEMLANAVHLTR
ncbi:hypothetical protein M0R72_21740, partial [Candidatus Pacearchaeota archaeon]|nr:hypothetical protein [Candidatus Pacearchaeota archaeon]